MKTVQVSEILVEDVLRKLAPSPGDLPPNEPSRGA
jgi:hypothetical protein